MTNSKPASARRSDALSKARIVQAATEMLDEGGTDALTFRTLAARLSTGPGALYHHVSNKEDLLAAATEAVMASVFESSPDNGATEPGVRGVMMRAFDAITTRPWVATQLAGAPWQPAVMHLFDRIGTELDARGVPEHAQFDAASVLMYHALGAASQRHAGRQLAATVTDRATFLDSTRSAVTDTGDYPFLTRIASQFAGHDDREQFQAGVDIILAGIDHP
ncbi:putative transcriptional regulator, TetR family [Rhodococcus sp. AW25M09]|uniref:TetR/AcrR family transcriptional regulator n=1 Tax=Rhodococcus sp. AW25M09 TaxID=1268303 RepID=UPI0002AC2886|nr:TetR/AcrR family transcriptional regulator [Rhodococcus sp. AW25M09]CCQ13671.1 putative transcriptional regulator, TetR family [Rhodococcus sp. AW25M09]